MAKIGVYFDQRRLDKDGRGMVCVSVAAGGQTRYVATSLKVLPDDWDERGKRVRPTAPLATRKNNMIRAMVARAELAAIELETASRKVSAAQIVAALKSVPMDEDVGGEDVEAEVTVESVYRRWVAIKRGRTAESYITTLNCLHRYCPEFGKLMFGDITKGWLAEWDNWMADNGVASANGRAVYMRNFRAVCNYAIDEGVTECYPFRRYQIKTVATAKRSLSVDELRAIFAYVPQEHERRWVTVFKLMFMLIGINAVDLSGIKKIKNGRIEYYRSKTGRLYSIKVEPEAMDLIREIKGKNYLVNLMDTNKSHATWLHNCNKVLGNLGVPIAERIGRRRKTRPIVEGLTTYWARHTWATIAASLDIPKDTIAHALGHGTNTVTDIYIDFDQRKVDEANRKVLDWVIYGKR